MLHALGAAGVKNDGERTHLKSTPFSLPPSAYLMSYAVPPSPTPHTCPVPPGLLDPGHVRDSTSTASPTANDPAGG